MRELNDKTIPEAVKAAEAANDQMAIQQVNDLKQFASRLDKRAYDLQLARQITIQQAPQIRLIQNTNQALAEKIQASINTAIHCGKIKWPSPSPCCGKKMLSRPSDKSRKPPMTC